MFEEEKVLTSINNYLQKLVLIINGKASFGIFGFKFIKKNRVDDILCCIEATLPSEYKDTVKRLGSRDFKGYNCYLELLESFKKYKSPSSEHYMIKYNIVLRQITVLKPSIKTDLKKVSQDNINKF